MLPTKVLFALTMVVAGSVAMANADSDEATSVDPYIEPTESGNVVAVIDSDKILGRDTVPDAEAELFERKPCKCRRVSHHICWFVFRDRSVKAEWNRAPLTDSTVAFVIKSRWVERTTTSMHAIHKEVVRTMVPAPRAVVETDRAEDGARGPENVE